MRDANGGRPLPWHDTATCDKADCLGPMVPTEQMANGFGGPRGSRIACAACGHGRVGSDEDVRKTRASARAFDLLESGKVHGDRGCARCNGALDIDRQRLCADCVARDDAERQLPMFSIEAST